MAKHGRITRPAKLTVLFIAFCALARAQELPPVILQIDTDNFVQYVEDPSDASKFATSPPITPGVVPRDFGPPFPGAPSTQAQANQSIVGGTGAYLGVRGETGGGTNPNAVAIRGASMVEDPAFRRTNGGG